METKDIISELNKISSYYNFIYTLADINLRDFCGTSDELIRKNPREHLNYHEYAFLVGLWIKNSTTKTIRCNYDYELTRIYKLMNLLQKSFINSTSLELDKAQSVADFMTDGTKFKEVFFYSGLGAYDDQYVHLTSKKYKLDDEWIKSNKGFSINSLQSFFINIKSKLTKKLNNIDYKKLISINRESNINLFILSYKEITNDNKDFIAILNSFSIELGKGHNKLLIDIGDFNEFKSNPIIKISDDKYFFSIPYAVAESFYETPYYWMTKDKQYINRSLRNRGLVSEEIAYNILSGIFTRENTFKGVKINRSKSTTVTDIDILIIHKDAALVFQIKSKKLTSVSKNGNIEKIKDDFKKAVEDAFLQGLVCEKHLLNSSGYEFINDKKIDISSKISSIKNVYIICLVLDVFPAIVHSTQILLYEKHSGSTICLSILDLEIICKYLKKPETVFDYLTKRINTCRYFYADKELSYLGFYLDQGLNPIEGFTHTFIEKDFGEEIDKLYYDEEYKYLQKTTQIHSKIRRNDLCPCGSGEKYKHCHLINKNKPLINQ